MNEDSARDFEDSSPLVDWLEVAAALVRRRWQLLLSPFLAGGLAVAASFLVEPVYKARTSFLPPQQQQSATAAALSSLGNLAGLAGGAIGARNPAEQYVSLLQSEAVVDRLIDRFDLMAVYESKLRRDARRELGANSHIAAGKKDGLIVIEVEDTSPTRAAEIANQYVEELRRLTSMIAVTEAQQRRVFFEQELKKTRYSLENAQQALKSSGFSTGALRAEPRTAAEQYGRLRAEVTAAEVRLQTMRGRFADDTAEVRQAVDQLTALRGQLTRLERAERGAEDPKSSDYISRLREFKYQETLFELFSRQYELARLDESREGALIQVVDRAGPPEWKSRPRRAVIGAWAAVAGLLAFLIAVVVRQAWRGAAANPRRAAQVERLLSALRDR